MSDENKFRPPVRNILKISVFSFLVLIAGFGLGNSSSTKAKYWSTVMEEDSIGLINTSEKALRGRTITFEPGAVAKFHVHGVPGIRYILRGAVTVKWKDGTANTYEAGSTFFEGPVGDRPARAHEVSNNGDVTAVIWNVELIPEADMQK